MKNEIIAERMSFWQMLAYTGLATLTLWLILKLLGVINTTVWLEYGVPVAALIGSIFGMYQNLLEKISNLAVSLATLNIKVDHIDKDVEIFKEDVAALKTKFFGN